MRKRTGWIALVLGLVCTAPSAQGAGWTPPPIQWSALYRLHADAWTGENYQYRYLDQKLLFQVAAPILDPRLGTVQAFAGLYTTTGEQGSKRQSTHDKVSGLGLWGLRLDLFPYRKFPLSLYYTRDQTDYLFRGAGGKIVNTQMGADLLYRGGYFENFRVNLSRFESKTGSQTSSQDLVTLDLSKTYGRTACSGSTTLFNSRASGQDQAAASGGSVGLYAHTQLTGGDFYNTLGYARSAFGETIFTSASLNSVLSLTTKSGDTAFGGVTANRYALGQDNATTLQATGGWQTARARELYRFGGALSTAEMDSSGQHTRSSLAQGYASWTHSLTSRLFSSIDAAYGTHRNADDPAGSSWGVHAGLGWGSPSLPGFLDKMAFAVQDRAFQRRLGEEFPPGYTPPELQIALQARQDQRVGAVSAGLDLYHFSEDLAGQRATSDVARLQGRFSIRQSLSVWVDASATRRRDPRLGNSDQRYGVLTLDYNPNLFHHLYLALSASQNRQTQPLLKGELSDTSQRGVVITYTYQRFRWMPLTLSAERYRFAGGTDFQRFRLSAPFQYGFLNASVLYEYTTMDHRRSQRVMLDFSRMFVSGGWR